MVNERDTSSLVTIYLLKGLKEKHKKVSQNSLCLSLHLNQAIPTYESNHLGHLIWSPIL
jgi:hypothetical protein